MTTEHDDRPGPDRDAADAPDRESAASGDPHALTTLVRVPTSFEAHTIVAVLANAGIEAAVFDTAEAGIGIPLDSRGSSVPVHVRERDLERARVVIDANVADSVDLDWDEIDVGQREDDLPLHRVDRLPVPAGIGLIAAFVMVVILLIAAIWLLVA